MSIVTQYAIQIKQAEIETLTQTVQWAKRNPYQCNLPLWTERLASAQSTYTKLLEQDKQECTL